MYLRHLTGSGDDPDATLKDIKTELKSLLSHVQKAIDEGPRCDYHSDLAAGLSCSLETLEGYCQDLQGFAHEAFCQEIQETQDMTPR